MAELRELFEMTTKQMEPDQDSWRKQEEPPHRPDRRPQFGALAEAVAVASCLDARRRAQGDRVEWGLEQRLVSPT